MRLRDLIPGATPTLRRRLAAKIQRSSSRNGCDRWTGAASLKRDGARRPVIQVGGRGSDVIHVARVLLALADGVPLPARGRLEAGHTCGHFWCVAPRHLRWVTRSENEDDKDTFDEATAYAAFEAAVDELAETG